MKLYILLISFLLLTSCGVTNKMNDISRNPDNVPVSNWGAQVESDGKNNFLDSTIIDSLFNEIPVLYTKKLSLKKISPNKFFIDKGVTHIFKISFPSVQYSDGKVWKIQYVAEIVKPESDIVIWKANGTADQTTGMFSSSTLALDKISTDIQTSLIKAKFLDKPIQKGK